MTTLIGRAAVKFAFMAVLLATARFASGASQDHSRSELIGLWHGTSVCTDRKAAPACRDEIVVYEFSAADRSDTVHWKADKVIDGKRQPMGELDLIYDRADGCWKGEYNSPRVHAVWCLTVAGTQLNGAGWLLPEKQIVRKITARKDERGP